MAIKSGQILTVGNGATVIDRIQTDGPGSLNIPTEKIYEVGNYESVATIRDIPDLSFSLETLDVSCEVEALLTGGDQYADNEFDLGTVRPIDIVSPFKRGKTATDPFDIDGSVALPFLMPESASYRFGLRDNASQAWTLRGDSIFYAPGQSFVQAAVGTNTANQAIVLTNPAGVYVGANGPTRALSVRVGGNRLTEGPDYTVTEDAGAFVATTVTIIKAVPASETIFVTYFSNVATEYPQTVHEDATVKPAAVRGKDIEVYLGTEGASYDPGDIPGSQQYKVGDVQSVNIDWRITLDRDEEFGNYYAVSQDYEVPEVSGTINIKPRSVDDLFDRIRKITGVTDADQAVGPNSAVPLVTDVVIKNPETHEPIKRFHIDDARYTLPGYSARVQTKLTLDLPFESDSGKLLVIQDTLPTP